MDSNFSNSQVPLSMARQMITDHIDSTNADEVEFLMPMITNVPPSNESRSSVETNAQEENETSMTSQIDELDSTSSLGPNFATSPQTLVSVQQASMSAPELVEQESSVLFHQSNLPQTTWPVLQIIRSDGKLCDVTLQVDGGSLIHAHRIILASTIPYFYAMFTNDLMVESKQSCVKIHTIDQLSLEALINFVYTGKLTITSGNVERLMRASNFLQMENVEEACSQFLSGRLTPSNVIGFHTFALSQVSSKSLATSCLKFISQNFNDVILHEEFLALDSDRVHSILSQDDLNVNSEEEVFRASVLWMKHHCNETQQILNTSNTSSTTSDSPEPFEVISRLLSAVRLPLLSPQFLSDHVATQTIIRSSHKCRDLIDEARDFHLMPERRRLMQSFKTKPRRSQHSIGLIYVIGQSKQSNESANSSNGNSQQNSSQSSSPSVTLEVLDPIVGHWKKVEECCAVRRSRVGVAVVSNKLFAIGGYNGDERLCTVQYLHPIKNVWTQVTDMTCRRSAVGCATLNGKLYVCGGFDGVSSLDTVERFDVGSGKWQLVASMRYYRSAAGVVELDGRLYALGGHNGLSIFESVECYDSLSDTWSECASMLSKRCRLGVACLNGRIYACGGYNGSSFLPSVEVYDPKTNSWSYASPMRVARSRVSLVSSMNRLYAIGGYDGHRNVSTVEIYDQRTDSWTDGPAMRWHEGGVGAAVITPEDDELEGDEGCDSIENNDS